MIVIEQVQLPNGVIVTRLISDDASWGTMHRAPTLQREPTPGEKVRNCLAQWKNKLLEGIDL